MNMNQCITAMQDAAGRELKDKEVNQLVAVLERRTKVSMMQNPQLTQEAAALRAAEEWGTEIKMAAIIEKRNAVINERKRVEGINYIAENYSKDYALGMQSILTGTQRSKFGARRSAASEQEQLRGYYVGGATNDLERAGVLPVLTSGAADLDIMKALWKLEDDTPDFTGILPEAVEAAKVIRKWQETARLDANQAGAWIGKLPGYIVRQSHDMNKIRTAGKTMDESYAVWKQSITPLLDWQKMARDHDDSEKFLREVFIGVATGQYLKVADEVPTGFKGPANLAKKASQERTLHFKDADSFYQYNQQFGSGNLRESFYSGLARSAESTGLMRILGTNPTSNFNLIADALSEKLRSEPEKLQAFTEAIGTEKAPGKVRNRLMQVDGSTRIPGNNMIARRAAGFRAIQSMAKLGMSTLSSFNDIPTFASEMRYQGQGMLSGMGKALGGLVEGRPTGERKEILSSLGVVFDSVIGDITRYGAHDDSTPGALSRGLQSFFKWNLNSWWTDSLQGSAALSMSHDLGFHSGKPFSQLRPELQRSLGNAGITDADWRAMNSVGARKADDGNLYLTPEQARSIPDDVLGIEGKKADVARRAIEDKFRSWFIDRSNSAVLHPDAETMAIMRQGTRPGTVVGEAARFIGQFKSFSVSFMQRVMGREIYGRGADTLAEAMRNGHGEMTGLANIILWSTAFGYLSMSAKDLLKGKNPRDPENYKTWFAAMVQGGGAGIYGDFLFGEANRFGGGFWNTALGPAAGTVNDVYTLYQKAKDGDDPSANALRLAINNTPYVNLFYTRPVLDYLILYRIQEALNPGYTRRLERNAKTNNAQEYWLRPSEAVH